MQRTDALLKFTYFRGRVALAAILRALHVGPGDGVATQAFTCLAVPEGIRAAGAQPVFVDVEPDGGTMDADDLRRRITPRTRAIVVQHTFGIPARMDALLSVAEEHGIAVIEDCCHTLTSRFRGKTVGSFGAASFFSYEWGKPVVAGIGGSAVMNDATVEDRLADDYQRMRAPRWTSEIKLAAQAFVHRWLYRPRFYWPLRDLFHHLSRLGAATGNYNHVSPDDEPAADFGLCMAARRKARLQARLADLPAVERHARSVVARYQAEITAGMSARPFTVPDESSSVYARYPLRVHDKTRLLAKARERNIEIAEWYRTPVHPLTREESSCVNYEPDSCPQAELRSRETISLPTHRLVNDRYIDRVCQLLSEDAR